MDTLLLDIRYALRGFGRQPAFALAVVAALALGIGANTVIFSVVNAVLLHPLALQAWKNPDRVMMLWEKNASLTLFFADQLPVRPRNYRAWKEQARSFQRMAAWRTGTVTVTDRSAANRKPEQVSSGAATANLFTLIGVHPGIGRDFLPAEMLSGQGQVAMLSDELFRSRFNSDPRVLGSALVIDGKPFTVVGVLPPSLGFPNVKSPKLWTPLNVDPGSKGEEASSLSVVGRLREGVSVATARAEMRVIEDRLAKTPLEEGGFGVNLATLREANTESGMRDAVYLLQVAVAFVLLIACANAGNLLLSRAVARDREVAIRSALGAPAFRLLRQTLTESVLLSCAAAILGLLLSLAAMRVLSALAPPDGFALHELRIDSSVLGFTAAVAAATGILFGLIPAWHTRHQDVNEVLKRSSGGVPGTSNRLRGALVVAEMALSLVLITGAGLMVRSLAILMKTDLGFETGHLLVVRLSLPDLTYTSPGQVASFNHRLIESVRAVTGVTAAALTTALPMKAVSQSSFEIPGRAHAKESPPITDWARVSDGYFETLHMPLLKGRAFTRQEAISWNPEVAIVNQAFAHTYFPNGDALGQLVTFGNEKGTNTTYRVVGVTVNEHQMGPDNEQAAELYMPGDHLRDFLLVARTAGDPLRLANAVKQQVWNIDKDQPVTDVMTEEAALQEWSAPRRFNMAVLVSFAVIAIVLAALGLYSVLAYTVRLRTREIGIRMAIGAHPGLIVLEVLRTGLSLALLGMGIGLVAALALTRFMASLIYGVNPFDPVTFAIVIGLLISIAFLASLLPAIRAAKIDPVEALRFE